MVFKLQIILILRVPTKKKNKKKKSFNNKIVFVNGFSASGKTMLAPIISSMENVEV